MDRHPYNGLPYYCTECGCGFAEFMACEDGDCALEDIESARERQAAKIARDARKDAKP